MSAANVPDDLLHLTGAQFDALIGDDDKPDEAVCLEQAEDEFERDPYSIAWWLNNWAGINVEGALSVSELEEKHLRGEGLTNAEWLVLLFNSASLCQSAQCELRERYICNRHIREEIKDRAAEIEACWVPEVMA
jgi:hypothetical protein